MASGSLTTTLNFPPPLELLVLDVSAPRKPSCIRCDEEQNNPSTSSEPPHGTTFFTRPDVSSVKWQLAAMNVSIFVGGVHDAATGALVPYLQPAYNIGLLFVALVYLFNFAGWAIAAGTNTHLTARFGTGGVMLFGAVLQLLAHALQFWKPPFPLFLASFVLSGLGVAYKDAQANSFVGGVNNAHRWLGVLHAVYGVGALSSPLIATKIASSYPEAWHWFYCALLGISVVNLACICVAFRKEIGMAEAGARGRAGTNLRTTVTNRSVIILSLFFFLYVGIEVTAGGWVVEFLIRVRGGRASRVGYIASGFWGGLTAGRVLLADITFRFGERRMIFLYLIISVVIQLLFWFIPNITADAVMISLLGFFIGPMFPTGISVATKLLPRELHVAAVGFVATTGQAGSAAFPFLTGAMAAREGVWVLQPVLVGLLVGLVMLWAAVPRVARRSV